ncbi:MAG TPA: hypothetical protein VEX41_01765 [Candidatus Eisenbacteria bacterium]|nr:hypothetical protein [Candidatus Eisenbacteria bacterium]
MVEISGLTIGAVAARLASAQPPLMRAAVLAQIADLVTFAFIWRSGDAERNPIGRLAMDFSLGLFGSRGVGFDDRGYLAVIVAALILFGLKVALIVFLVRVVPYLGRYRRAVLVVAIAVGTLGAVSNVLAFPIPPTPTG